VAENKSKIREIALGKTQNKKMHVSFLLIFLLKTIIQDVFQRIMQFSQMGIHVIFSIFYSKSGHFLSGSKWRCCADSDVRQKRGRDALQVTKILKINFI
jgi:hypothetical protein